MTMESLLRVAGALQIILAALHVFFPARFRWREELARLSLLNRQIFIVHTIFICFILLLMGSLSFFAPQALLEASPLSRMVLGGFAAFWALRLLFQWFVYDAALWRGDRFNTAVHVLFSLLWLYLTAVYASALFAG